MSKKKPLLAALDKKTRERHFPESNGGKGSHARKSTQETRDAFKKNYDAIDWTKK
jgi:stalled ribosome alternative rescue factor ArfA